MCTKQELHELNEVGSLDLEHQVDMFRRIVLLDTMHPRYKQEHALYRCTSSCFSSTDSCSRDHGGKEYAPQCVCGDDPFQYCTPFAFAGGSFHSVLSVLQASSMIASAAPWYFFSGFCFLRGFLWVLILRVLVGRASGWQDCTISPDDKWR